jgi:predicted outer membrane repeat protein
MFPPSLGRTLRVLVLAIAPLSAAPARAGTVWVVQGRGAGRYGSIQSAIDAAGDGGVMIVGRGSYAPFVIDGRSIVLYAVPGADVEVTGTIEIRNVASSQAVFVAGLASTGVETLDGSGPGLRLANCAGHVRFLDCTFRGGAGTNDPPHDCSQLGRGSPGASVDGSARVAFTRCTLVGGASGSEDASTACAAFDGADGLLSNQSVVCLHQCVCAGGAGGDAGSSPGAGGRGASATGDGWFASGTSFTGGRGGDAWDSAVGADGGDGVFVASDAGVHLLDCALAGGAGGAGLQWNGNSGAPSSGPGVLVQHPGATRWVEGPRIASDLSSPTITFHGTAGDQMVEQGSSVLDFVFLPASTGFRFLLPPLSDLSATVTIASGSSVATSLSLPDVASPSIGTLAHTQGRATDAQGAVFLENPLDVLVLDRGAAPDCNGNGVLDFLDLLEGTSQDCDGNLVPDECDLAGGAPDCNANGVPDSCDLASGASQDLDHDGIPDECEEPVIRYVDPAAAAGGDGSYWMPFRTIRDAIDASRSGDTVLLEDGAYSGPGATNLVVSPRTNLLFRSAHGAGSCKLDLAGNGKAFVFAATGGPASLVEGIAFQNGSSLAGVGGAIEVTGANLTIRSCTFQGCQAGSGGAVSVAGGAVIVDHCVFQGNATPTGASYPGAGGALALADAPQSIVRWCSFTGNRSKSGGAVSVHGAPGVRLSHSTFASNVASVRGGACWAEIASSPVGVPASFDVDDCLFTGNTTNGDGGALAATTFTAGAFLSIRVASSTFSANGASRGGAVAAAAGSPLSLADSIFWGDAAGAGPEIALVSAAPFDPPDAKVLACDVEGGLAAIDVEAGTLADGGENLALDPGFAAGFELAPTSPCIDAGNDGAVLSDAADVDGDGDTSERVPFDLARRPRIWDDQDVPDTGAGPAPVVDMGAFERWTGRNARVRSHP